MAHDAISQTHADEIDVVFRIIFFSFGFRFGAMPQTIQQYIMKKQEHAVTNLSALSEYERILYFQIVRVFMSSMKNMI